MEKEVVCLRPITLEDTDKIVAWRNREDVRERFIYQGLFTRESHEKWFHTMVETGKVCQMMICLKESKEAVGSVYIRDIDKENGKGEYGIFIGEESARGKGIGTQAARLMIQYGFEKLGLHRLFLRAYADNGRAIRSYEKAGFTREAYLRDDVCVNGVYRDIVLMGICKGQETAGSKAEELKSAEPEKQDNAEQSVCRSECSFSGKAEKNQEAQQKEERKKLVSFVIPCYRSAHTLPHVIKEIEDTMAGMAEKYSHEIILVNDSSPDNTWEVICDLCKEHKNIKGINFARNFGQHAGLMAGLRKSKGDYVVCLDDDGQTPADEVGKLLEKLEDGQDAVYASYDHKQHSLFRNLGSKVNELMTRVMLNKPADLYISSYFAVKRFVVEDMIRYQNSYPYVIGLVLRATKNIVNVPVHHREREEGRSGYTLSKLLGLWFNGFTAFSVKPLRVATVVGGTSAVVGFLYGIYTIIKKLVNPNVPMGFSSTMAALVFFGGMIMLMLGLIGEYIGRIYISMNNSPQYVIREETKEPKTEED